jgi:hypothetical protein
MCYAFAMRRTIDFSDKDEQIIAELSLKQEEETGQSSLTAVLRLAIRLLYKQKCKGKPNG